MGLLGARDSPFTSSLFNVFYRPSRAHTGRRESPVGGYRAKLVDVREEPDEDEGSMTMSSCAAQQALCAGARA